MAGRKNSLLDSDFEDEDDLLPQPSFGDDDEGDEPSPGVAVEIEDDTPPEDRNRWNADKEPTDGEAEDDEATQYSKKVKARLGKEAARYHAERRAKEDRERQLNEAVALAQRLIGENNQLKGFIENGEKVFMTEHQQRLESQINAAKSAMREAHEAGDINGQIAAQENLSKLVAQADRISTHRAQPLQRMDDKRELDRFRAPTPQEAVQPEPEALSWQQKNKWFGRDEGMTAYAMALHKQLTERDGIMPEDGKEYWNRLDADLRKRFPERYSQDRTGPRRTDTVVAPASRSATGKATRKVTLTESQVGLARRLGLTPQQYAEQLVAEGNGSKEWTHGRKS